MATAFQPNAFQNDAFQIEVGLSNIYFITDALNPPIKITGKLEKQLSVTADYLIFTVTFGVRPDHYYMLQTDEGDCEITRWVEYTNQ